MSAEDIPIEFQSPEGLRTLANYLRGSNGVKVKSGIEHDKRVDYFRGKKLVATLLEAKKWPKTLPKIESKETAIAVANLLCQHQFYHRSEKVEGKRGVLMISKKNFFEEDGYFTWMYAGNMVWSNIATAAIIAVVIIFTLLPIWPNAAKRVLWYCSVTFLIAVISFCTVRFLLYLLLWLVGYDFWILPRLFDETLSFQDSFKPLYSFESGSKGQGYYRLGVIAGILAFIYWAMTQPTEFDEFLKAQKNFIDDIYEGKLLPSADDAKEMMDNTRRRVPNVEDLIREMEADERLEAGGSTEYVNLDEQLDSNSGKKTDIDMEYDDLVDSRKEAHNLEEGEEDFSDLALEEILNAAMDDMDA